MPIFAENTQSLNETSLDLNQANLTHELQLGEQLNESIHKNRRSDFSLMLAMLVDDVREQSQFKLPRIEDNAVLNESVDDSEQLRKLFSLRKAQALGLEKLSDIEKFNEAPIESTTSLVDIHLSDALAPKALAFRDDKSHINHDVSTNTSLFCQAMIKSKKVTAPSRSDFNAKAWLKALETTIVKSSLVSV